MVLNGAFATHWSCGFVSSKVIVMSSAGSNSSTFYSKSQKRTYLTFRLTLPNLHRFSKLSHCFSLICFVKRQSSKTAIFLLLVPENDKFGNEENVVLALLLIKDILNVPFCSHWDTKWRMPWFDGVVNDPFFQTDRYISSVQVHGF